MLKVSTGKSVIATLKISWFVYFPALFVFLWTKPLLAQELVRDISVSTRNTIVRDTCMVGDTFYFTTVSLETGVKTLWCTNGQTNGTIALANTAQPNGPTGFDRMTAWKGKLYFATGDREHRDLWSSDGTVAGTKKFKTDVGFLAQKKVVWAILLKVKTIFSLSQKKMIWNIMGLIYGEQMVQRKELCF